MNLLALAPNDWNGPWMNRQQFLSRLGKYHKIIYSNGLMNFYDRFTPKWKQNKLFGSFEYDGHVLIESPPKVLFRLSRVRQVDNILLKLWTYKVMNQLREMSAEPFVLYIFHPKLYSHCRFFKPDFLVYHAYDLFRRTPAWDENLEFLEGQLVKKADLVVSSSKIISDNLRLHMDRPINCIPNGVDFDAFDGDLVVAEREPDDLSNISKPRIGYSGNINRKVDLSLVSKLAKKKENWQFVFIGGISELLDDETKFYLNECVKLPNIHFLGFKKHNDLSKYICKMDVNIMCYRIDDDLWTYGGYPLKMHEYLATGIPVVSSDLPAIREFSSVISIVHGLEEWERGLAEAILNGGVGSYARRRDIAKENTWISRVATLNKCLISMKRCVEVPSPSVRATS